MAVLKTILTVVYILVCAALVVVVCLQESKSEGLSGALIGGSTNTYFGKNKSRTKEGMMVRATIILGAIFIVLSIVLQLKIFQ